MASESSWSSTAQSLQVRAEEISSELLIAKIALFKPDCDHLASHPWLVSVRA